MKALLRHLVLSLLAGAASLTAAETITPDFAALPSGRGWKGGLSDRAGGSVGRWSTASGTVANLTITPAGR